VKKFRIGVVALVAMAFPALLGIGPVGAAASTDVVRAQTTAGWFGLNEGPSGSVGTVTFVQGPGSLPAGSGSVQLAVDATGRATIGSNQFKGTRFDALTGLTYWVYVPSAAGNGYPVLQMSVDFNLNDANTAYQGRVSFNLGSVPLNTWTQVNALTGTYFRSQPTASPLLACATSCTIAQILAQYPNAGIRNAPGSLENAVLLRLGGPIAPSGATVFADVVTVATAANTKIVDFEPGATLEPNVGPPGTAIVVKGYGFKPKAKVRFHYLGYGRPKQTLLCRSVANTAGVAMCSSAVPTGARAGNIGVHPVWIRGKSPTGAIEYRPEFFRT